MAYFSREVLFLPPQAKRAFFFLLHEFLLPPHHKQVLFLLLRDDSFLTKRPNFGATPGVSHKPKRVFSFTSPKRVFSFTVEAQGHKGSFSGTRMVLGWFLLNSKTPPFTSQRTLFAFLWVAALAFLFVWQRNTTNDFLLLGVFSFTTKAQGLLLGYSDGSRVVPSQPQNATFRFSQDPLRVPVGGSADLAFYLAKEHDQRLSGAGWFFSFTAEAQGRKGSSSGTRMVVRWFLLNPKTPPFASHKTLFAFLWQPPKLRQVVFCLTEFGGVGDNVTLNTEAFERGVGSFPSWGIRVRPTHCANWTFAHSTLQPH
ncbi:uncharacterized protein HKW66_Vig0081780 [Vigna angularis]|uniref:Uncharacterized protein n=1 Tax=Phaseolus angularis TaxID=3914 RepID=A0A8T0KHA2_PHAAN|nr:uncharacterized protein HKW66_Vig0081780 [Vigna angularis]